MVLIRSASAYLQYMFLWRNRNYLSGYPLIYTERANISLIFFFTENKALHFIHVISSGGHVNDLNETGPSSVLWEKLIF